ncbi:AAA family ATPase [Ferrovibrio sp.]|uniref:AAA family ATPase n=1 Tax=Ferrovibrio sp. TaxID=1917215 RepID=UPI0035AFE0DF
MYGANVSTFVRVGNVKKFLGGISALEERGAPEATLMVVAGEVGLGKSSTARWYAVQNRLPYVVMKPQATPGWLLDDLCRAMGLQPPRYAKDRFNLIIQHMAKTNRGIVIDEVEHALANAGAALEQLRAIGDATELPIILVGREYVGQKIARIPAVKSRVTSTVTFQAVTREDFGQLLTAFGLNVQGDVASRLVKATGGSMRLGMNELRRLRDWSDQNKGKPVTPDLIKGGDDAGGR